MTAIAAYKIKNVPVLIGDLLVSSTKKNKAAGFIATNPRASKLLHRKTGRDIASLRKKVHILHPKVAVAWSGSMLAASDCLGRLNSLCKTEVPTKDSLEKLLTNIDDYLGESLNLHIIGWLVDKNITYCFRWNSSYPTEIFYEDSHYEGSGEKLLVKFINTDELVYRGPGITNDVENAQYTLINIITRLLEHEISTGETLNNLFGFFHEAVFFDGFKFKYISDITFLIWDILCNEIISRPIICKYQAKNKFSIVQIAHTSRDHFALVPYALKSENTFVNTITPVFKQKGEEKNYQKKRLDMSSEYYAHFFHYKKSKFEDLTATLVNHKSDTDFFIHSKVNKKELFQINKAKILDMLHGNLLFI